MVLRTLIRQHEEYTSSPRARQILEGWDRFRPLFRRIAPRGGAMLVAAARDKYLAAYTGAPAAPALVTR